MLFYMIDTLSAGKSVSVWQNVYFIIIAVLNDLTVFADMLRILSRFLCGITAGLLLHRFCRDRPFFGFTGCQLLGD